MNTSCVTVVLLCFTNSVWAALECTDWEGRSVVDGMQFNPKKEDPCYVCRCNNGQSTMCSTVSCGAPNCKYWQQIPGQCCQFECLDTEPPDFKMNGRENNTSSPPSGPDSSGTISDSTMTDLGLRLAASTVTTFLILALLLFLLHRLRQKRLRMALRRYSHRRHDPDDSDNVSYSPDFFGLQCPPPYEDPPPPYSPPKPRHGHVHGPDQPPPYEAIDDNENIGQVDNNRNQTVVGNENQSGVTGSITNHRNSSHQNGHMACGDGFSFSAGHDLIDPRNFTGRCSERDVGNFSTDITDVITSDAIQNRPYSFVQSRTVPKVEARNDPLNGQITHGPNNVSDIGESTSSSDSDDSRNSSPVPTEYETRGTLLHPDNEVTQSGGNKVESGVALSEDAESTVRQFLNHQFGQVSKNRNRNFPTAMSQSWTCSEQASTAPHLGLAGAFNRNSGYFQQSSCGNSNSNRQINSEVSQNLVPKMGLRCGKCNNVIACKCNKVKTNGLLTRSQSDYTQNAKGSAAKDNIVSRNRNIRLLPGSFGARVSYVEPEEIAGELTAKADNHNSSQYHSDSETNISYFAPNTERISPNVSHCDDSDVPTRAQRQDLLRELRLSHLLFSPPGNGDSSPSPQTPPQASRMLLPKSKNIHSQNSAFTLCSETGEKRNVKQCPGVLNNDAQYPDFIKTSLSPRNSGVKREKHLNEKNATLDSQRRRLNFSSNTLQSVDRITVESEEDNTRQMIGIRAKHLPNLSNTKLRNSDIPSNYIQDFSNTVPEVSHFNFCMPSVTNPNVNSGSCAMKFCNDKDVSKFVNSIVSPHLNVMLHDSRNTGVPTVSERANASQFYNCEHEEKVVKKSKKKLLRKRHSASSYPAERSSSPRKSDQVLKQSPKQKSATLKGKHLRQVDLSDYDHSNSDSANKTNFIAGRQYYKTIDNHKQSAVRTGISASTLMSSPSKARSSPKKQPFLECRGDSQWLSQRNSFRSSNNDTCSSFVMSPVLDPSPANPGAKFLPKSSCHSDPRSQSLHSKKHHKRSKSLGKDECYVGLHVGNKHTDRHSSQKPSSRKKKNRQSFPGTDAFHRELEHVLDSQKQAMSLSMTSSAMGQQRGLVPGMHAVTQV